jgi:hypothetical protein
MKLPTRVVMLAAAVVAKLVAAMKDDHLRSLRMMASSNSLRNVNIMARFDAGMMD